MKPFSCWEDVEAWLAMRGLFHMNLGLHRMLAAITALHLEHPPFQVIQVLGTNGKGSTSSFLSSLAIAHDSIVGLYTSPHFVSPRERIRVNGIPVSCDALTEAANEIAQTAQIDDLTYFEFLTLMALVAFRDAGISMAILEAGLGGANDATTAIPADMLCFCPIAMDHAAIIGPGIADIARDKAAAIRSSAPVFSAPQFPTAERELLLAAQRFLAPVHWAEPLADFPMLALAGQHQHGNAALALAAWTAAASALGVNPGQDKIRKGLTGAFIPGRLQFIPACAGLPSLILDGAHNPHGMASLVTQPDLDPAAIVFSCLADKDWHSVLGLLARRFPHKPFYFFQLNNERAAHVEDMAAFCSALGADARIAARNLDEAIMAAGPGPTLITGSLFLLAEFFKLHPRYLEREQ